MKKPLLLATCLLACATAQCAVSGAFVEMGMKEAKVLELKGPPEKTTMLKVREGSADEPPKIYEWSDIKVIIRNGRVSNMFPVDPRVRQELAAEERRRVEAQRATAETVRRRRLGALEAELRRMEALLTPAPDRPATSEAEKASLRLKIAKVKQEIEALPKP